jgi:4'-phosphopantetheinyl transferase
VDIHWFQQTAGDIPLGDHWLSADERVRLEGLRFPKRHADWRLGRWTAKLAVADYLDLPPEPEVLAEVELRPAPSGRPDVFLSGWPAPVALSLSHRCGAGLTVVAPAGVAVGCDLETVEPRSPEFLADYFTVEEQTLVGVTPAYQRDRLVTLLWSAKESALKSLGCGLRMDTRAVSAVPAGFLNTRGEEWQRLSVQMGGRILYGWWSESRRHIRTVVSDPPPLRLIELQLGARGRLWTS